MAIRQMYIPTQDLKSDYYSDPSKKEMKERVLKKLEEAKVKMEEMKKMNDRAGVIRAEKVIKNLENMVNTL